MYFIVFRHNRGASRNGAFLKYLPLKIKNCFWLIMSIAKDFLLCNKKKKWLLGLIWELSLNAHGKLRRLNGHNHFLCGKLTSPKNLLDC